MTGKSAANFDDLMFTSIDSEDFLDNEEKPSLTSSWSSDSEKDCQWKSSNSSLSQLQSPPKQSDLPVCSTPLECTNSNDTKFLTCHETSVDSNARSLSRVNISDILVVAKDEMNLLASSSHSKSKRSLSLHDLDHVFEFPSNKLAKNAVSCEMSNSLASSKTRSKDSGIHRTGSCVSLLSNNTYNKKYDHVQSKVKQYIQNMKELGRKNRESKNTTKPCIVNCSESRLSSETMELSEAKFNELQNEILDKDALISAYHEKYTSLQIKYANLKRQYDALRFGSTFHDESFSPDQLDHSTEEPLQPDVSNFRLSDYSYQSCNLIEPVSPSSSKSLKPITKIHSTSANLNRQFVPLQSGPMNKSAVSLSLEFKESSLKPYPDSKLSRLESADIREDDPFLKVQRWQESLSTSKFKDTSSAGVCSPTSDQNDEKVKLKKTKPRRRLKRSKPGVEIPDVLQNLTKKNPTTFEDLREADTNQRLKPISTKNMFKPAQDSGDSLRNIPKPDMLPFAFSTKNNSLNIKKYYASKNVTSQKYREDTTNEKSSQELVPTFSSPKSGPVANVSGDKSNKSALCCCLEASDLYINQLNEGLDKLMIALTELGTSTVFKS